MGTMSVNSLMLNISGRVRKIDSKFAAMVNGRFRGGVGMVIKAKCGVEDGEVETTRSVHRRDVRC